MKTRLFLIFLLLIPSLCYSQTDPPDFRNLVGEYALTESSEKDLLEAGVDAESIDLYRTLYLLKCVDGLQIESQNMQGKGGMILSPHPQKDDTFVNEQIKVVVTVFFSDQADLKKAKGLIVQMERFKGRYHRIDRGPTGADEPDTDFPAARPEDLGLDPEKIDIALTRIRSGYYENIHGLLVLKDGRLVVEEYFNGSNAAHRHQIRSSGKSITSIVMGIAIDKGHIPNADQKVYPYFAEYAPPDGWGPLKNEITIRHLLTMTSGLGCDDWRPPKFRCSHEMWAGQNWLDYALNIPEVYKPGTHWAYNGAALMIISGVIRKATGTSHQDFALKHLFEPLGIKEYPCLVSPKGNAYTGGSSKLKARDMARLGYLYLRQGQWQGRQIVSRDWVRKSTSPSVTTSNQFDYGYLWWLGQKTFGDQKVKMYYAAGNGGQNIFVFPSLDMVVVFTGGNYSHKLANQMFGILAKHIVPAALPDYSPPRPIDLPDEKLDRYLGTYRCDYWSFTIKKKAGQLILFSKSKKGSPLYPISREIFVTPNKQYENSTVKFVIDADGRVLRMFWHKYWRSFELTKVD